MVWVTTKTGRWKHIGEEEEKEKGKKEKKKKKRSVSMKGEVSEVVTVVLH